MVSELSYGSHGSAICPRCGSSGGLQLVNPAAQPPVPTGVALTEQEIHNLGPISRKHIAAATAKAEIVIAAKDAEIAEAQDLMRLIVEDSFDAGVEAGRIVAHQAQADLVSALQDLRGNLKSDAGLKDVAEIFGTRGVSAVKRGAYFTWVDRMGAAALAATEAE